MAAAQVADGKRIGGTVRWFSGDKGYGFISPDDGGEDLFVHHSSILSSGFRGLSDGQPVEFVVDSGPDGRPRAVDVTGPEGSSLSSAAGGGGSGACYNCGESGHLARDCLQTGEHRGGGYGSGECFNCGRRGHLARDCRDAAGGGRRRSNGGYDGGGFGGGACYNCGRSGHLARDCGENGGDRRAGAGSSRGCYNCGEQGHFARECPQASS